MIISRSLEAYVMLYTCNAPKAYVTLFRNTIHKLLLNTLIRSNKPDDYGAATISKDKALSITLKLT